MNSKVLKSIFFSTQGLRWGWIIIFYLVIVVAAIAIIIAPLVFLLSLFNLSPQPQKPITGWSKITGSVITLLVGYSAFYLQVFPGISAPHLFCCPQSFYHLLPQFNRLLSRR